MWRIRSASRRKQFLLVQFSHLHCRPGLSRELAKVSDSVVSRMAMAMTWAGEVAKPTLSSDRSDSDRQTAGGFHSIDRDTAGRDTDDWQCQRLGRLTPSPRVPAAADRERQESDCRSIFVGMEFRRGDRCSIPVVLGPATARQWQWSQVGTAHSAKRRLALQPAQGHLRPQSSHTRVNRYLGTQQLLDPRRVRCLRIQCMGGRGRSHPAVGGPS